MGYMNLPNFISFNTFWVSSYTKWSLIIQKHVGHSLIISLTCYWVIEKSSSKPLLLTWYFLYFSEVSITFPTVIWSIPWLLCARDPPRHVWNLICVIYKGCFLFLIMYFIWLNKKVNSESSEISSVVLIYKTTLYFESLLLYKRLWRINPWI